MYCAPPPPPMSLSSEDNRLEIVTTCVGFDDVLDISLGQNSHLADTVTVVTSFDDKRTHAVCKKHGAFCVQTDLFKKNGRNFNKGAAINAGMDRFQYAGWRLNLDADTLLPNNFRQILFNHTYLNKQYIYGADRIDVIGLDTWKKIHDKLHSCPQHIYGCLVDHGTKTHIGARYVDKLRGYCPIGYFQLWHYESHKDYPYSLGSAAHDDVIFASLWAEQHRILLPQVVVYHLCGSEPVWSENWNGNRKNKRIDGK